MTPDFQRPPAHPLCPRTTVAGLAGDGHGAEDPFVDAYGECPVVLLTGDVAIDAAWQQALWAEEGNWFYAVDGNVRVEGRPERLLSVTGDLHCGSVSLSAGSPRVRGRIFARDLVELMGDDDEDMHRGPRARAVTPHLFAWFMTIDQLEIDPGAALFVIGDHDHCRQLALPNPTFLWHEAAHALREDIPWLVEDPASDTPYWNLERIGAALAAGEEIFRPGFSLQALPLIREAEEAAAIGETRASYLLFKAAASKAPGYGPAWLGMGEALAEAGAYEQALHCCDRAMELFPSRQHGLVLTPAILGARCALRFGRYALAAALASRALAHSATVTAWIGERAHAHRFRAEARHLAGDRAGAAADLAEALRIDPGYGVARWLAGLLDHVAGRGVEAAEHHRAASGRDVRLAAGYDEARDTSFLGKPPTRVDWDELPLEAGLLVKDAAYWARQLRGEPMRIVRVPEPMRTADLCLEILKGSGLSLAPFVAHLPATRFTRELALALARRDSGNLAWIPAPLVDRELCLATPEDGRFSLEHVPAAVLDADVCRHALRGGARIADVPAGLLDAEMCRDAVARSSYAIEAVPPRWRSDELWIAAMATGGHHFVENHVPARLKSPDAIARVVAHDRRALETLPGVLICAEVHAAAKERYGADPDWRELESRHGRKACRREHPGQCARHCWRAFWNEAFLLREIRESESGYRLSAYEIPEAEFTPAIAAACFESEPIHIDSIPPRLTTPDMWRRFVLRYPDRLAHVPVAHRDVAACARALMDEPSQVTLVPAELHAALFDLLLRQPGDLEPGWLLLERGRGHLMATPPRLAEAMSDFQNVVETGGGGEEPSESRVAQATYLLGYCHHRRSEHRTAELALLTSGLAPTWGDYPTFDLVADKETVDFDRRGFDLLMHESERSRESGDLELAYAGVLDAGRMLAASGCRTPAAWAHVLDARRYLAFELGLWDVHDATCREAIGRLEKVTLWHYLRCDDAVRHALRAAHRNLALRVLAAEAPSAAELAAALSLLDRALAIRGAAEDEDVLHPIHEGRAAILVRLARLDARYAEACEAALEAVASLRLAERGLVEMPDVLEALARRTVA